MLILYKIGRIVRFAKTSNSTETQMQKGLIQKSYSRILHSTEKQPQKGLI